MRTIVTLAIALLATTAVSAQGGLGGGEGRRGGMRGGMRGMSGALLAIAADLDGSGDVSAAEWTGFFDKLNVDEEGVVDKSKLAHSIFVNLLDQDADAKLEKSDLEKIHAELDKNDDGVLQEDEAFRRRGGRGDRGDRGDRRGRRGGGGGGQGGDGGGFLNLDEPADAPEKKAEEKKEEEPKTTFATRYKQQAVAGLIRTADADSNREITVDEWKNFLGSLEEKSGALTSEQITKLMNGPEREESAEGEEDGRLRRGMRRGMISFDQMLGMMLPENANKEELEKVFQGLDKNEDKALQAEELDRQRNRRRRPV
ncbi:MAG: hypothetical protein AAF488_11435 [Planctomycetota bacterium]